MWSDLSPEESYQNPYVPPLQPEGKLSWLLSSGQSRPGQRLHRVFSGAATRAILLLALTYNKHLSAASIYLPIKCLSSACGYFCAMEKEGANKRPLVQGHQVLWPGLGLRHVPDVAQKEAAEPETSADSQDAPPVVTALQWSEGWSKLLEERFYSNWNREHTHSKGMGQHHCPHEEQPVSSNESTWISLIWKSERIIFSYLVDPLQEIFISTWEAIRPSPWWVP